MCDASSTADTPKSHMKAMPAIKAASNTCSLKAEMLKQAHHHGLSECRCGSNLAHHPV